MQQTHSNLEQLSCSLAVTGSNDGCVDVNESSLLEELVDGHCSCIAYPKDSREDTCLWSEVGELSDVLQSMDHTSLEWVVLQHRWREGRREGEKEGQSDGGKDGEWERQRKGMKEGEGRE